jgi:hypothetical protein
MNEILLMNISQVGKNLSGFKCQRWRLIEPEKLQLRSFKIRVSSEN